MSFNKAPYGGALALNASARFALDSPSITFSNNSALLGGVLYGDLGHQKSLSTASFFYNMASMEGCIISLQSSGFLHCPVLNTSGSYSSNYQEDTIDCLPSNWICDGTSFLVPSESPPFISSTGPITCPEPRPTPAAECFDGTWVVSSEELEGNPTVVISAPVIVIGNLTTPTVTVTNVFGSEQPILQSDSCITIGTIIVELTEVDVEKLDQSSSRTVVLSRSGCNPTSMVAVEGKPKRSCKRIESQAIREGGTLSATLRVNSSKCNVWWIALVSTLGGLIIVVVIIIVVLQVKKGIFYKQESTRLK
jgi:predicted outer membrane repeat protein